MGQLIRFSTTSFEAVRFSQNARLVPSDQIDIERRKAIARHNAFQTRTSSGGAFLDMNYINRVNKTFAVKKPAQSVSVPAPVSSEKSATLSASSVRQHQAATPIPAQPIAEASVATRSTEPQVFVGTSASSGMESEAAYTTQRGAFELRVAKGDVSYVPAMVMTIITQYPEVNFEYLGGFNYVPPSYDPIGSNMNYTV